MVDDYAGIIQSQEFFGKRHGVGYPIDNTWGDGGKNRQTRNEFRALLYVREMRGNQGNYEGEVGLANREEQQLGRLTQGNSNFQSQIGLSASLIGFSYVLLCTCLVAARLPSGSDSDLEIG
jgi:hypothetical protein